MTLPHSVEFFAGEFLAARGARVSGENSNSHHDTPSVFDGQCLDFLDRGRFDEELIACHGALGSSRPPQNRDWAPWHGNALRPGRQRPRPESLGQQHSPGPRSFGRFLQPSCEGRDEAQGPSKLLRAWRYSCGKLSSITSERQVTTYTTRPPNYSLHPPSCLSTPCLGLHSGHHIRLSDSVYQSGGSPSRQETPRCALRSS